MADLIEYMYGGENTTWGKVRFADGHPETYKAKFFELGNEQYNPSFPEQMAAMEAKAKELGHANEFFLINAANAGSFVGWRMEYWNKYLAGGNKGTAKKKAQRWKLKDFVGTILEITSEETVLDSGTSTTTALVRWDAEKDGTKYNDEPVFLVESLWGAHADHGWYISKPEAQEETAVHGDALADMKAARLKAEFTLMELT